MDFKFRIFRGQNLSDEFEFFFIHGLLLVRTMQQARWRKLVAAGNLGESRFRLVLGVGALGDFEFDGRELADACGADANAASSSSSAIMRSMPVRGAEAA